MSLPFARFTHDERIEIAKHLSRLVLEKYGNRVLAVCVSGSTAKKLDRPFSDLEMFVVVRDGDGNEIPSRKYLYKGMIVGVDYRLESRMLKEASQVGWWWPWQADEFRNRIALFERDSWLSQLQQAVAVSDKASSTEAISFAAANLTEDMTTFQNALLTKDPLVLKSCAMTLASDGGNLVLLLNRRFVVTSSWFWKQVFECSKKPVDIQELTEVLMGLRSSSREELRRCAEKLYLEIMSLVASSGVSIEFEQLTA